MSYLVLARKWRPMTFSDLVGQEHVAATLGNAIKTGRVAHAFLFTGVRGVGKTTSARILAKALNCLSSDGPTATPCLQCAACREITQGTDVDVQEIDGASYNGVDEVRRLQESMPYRPARDRYKIYIVDEVHMLSNNAWNAFLKTLEEPPPHVKFIFATTEVHKVPVTILSRVQRFDFRLISTRQIAGRLRFVLEQEGLQAEEAALAILAREAAGSMRDAMSLLDQVIAWSEGPLSEQGVASVLGVASRKVLYELVAELIAGQAAAVLRRVDSLANQGFDIAHVTRDLLAVLRDVVVVASTDDTSDLVDLPDEERASVAQLAKNPVDDLLRLHQGFSNSFDQVVRSGQPRAALEMSLVRLAHRPPLIPVDDLIDRLIRLEKRLHGAGRGPTSPAGPAPAARPPSPARGAPSAGPPGQNAGPSARSALPNPSAPPARAAGASTSNPPVPVPSAGHRTAPSNALPTAVSPTAVSPPVSPAPSASATADAAPPVSQPPRHTTTASNADSEHTPVERWRKIVDAIGVDDPKVGAFLAHAEVLEVTADALSLRYQRASIAAMALDDQKVRESIQSHAERLFGAGVVLKLELVEKTAQGPSVFAADKAQREEQEQAALSEAKNHPVVLEAVRVLGARLKHIELPKPQ